MFNLPENALVADVPSAPRAKKRTVLKLGFPMPAREVKRTTESRYKLFGSRKYGDAVAPEGPYPKVIADRDCHGARCEGFGIRLIDELCYLQCFGIDPHHVCRLLSLARCQNGAIRSKSDVVYAKT